MSDLIISQLKKIDSLISTKNVPNHNGLMSGRLGVLLFKFYYSNYFEGSVETCFEGLEEIFNNFNEGDNRFHGYALAEGLTGFIIVLNILQEEGFLECDDDEALHQLLEEKIMFNLDYAKIDYLHASMGMLHTLLQNEKFVSETFIKTIIAKIEEIGSYNGDGFRIASEHPIYKDLGVDFGLSHGMCGLLLVLVNLCNMGFETDTLKRMIKAGIQYIIKFKNSENAVEASLDSLYPLGVDTHNEKPYQSNILGWCYGDLNILHLLEKANLLLKDPSLNAEIEHLILNLKLRELDSTEIKDSHFCHGSAGVAYYFNYLFKLTGKLIYHECYKYWIGIATRHLQKELEEDYYADKSPELLEGLCGVGLVLLTELNPKLNKWDKIFFI
jgi:lantibiotic biosynthesis protein